MDDPLDDLIDQITQDPPHSLLGASGMSRWVHCPGSFRLSQKAPPRRASIHAATGTLAHSFIEELITESADPRQGLALSPTIIGSTHQVETHAVTVDEDFVDGVNMMLDYVAQAAMNYALMVTEMKVVLDGYMDHPPPVKLFGRLDVGLLDPASETAEIIDFKNGSGILISPIDNDQLLYYAAGFLAYIKANLPSTKIKRIRLTVVQPHARVSEKIRSWDIDVADVILWTWDVLNPAVEVCASDDAPLHTGPWCRFCPASIICPKLIEAAQEMAKKDFADHLLPDSPEALSEALDTALNAEAWISALRSYAEEQIKSGVKVPHYAMEPTRPMRRWVDASLVEDTLTDLKVPRSLSHKFELRSPAQIEKALKGNGSVWGTLQGYVESLSSGTKLVRSNVPDALEEFE